MDLTVERKLATEESTIGTLSVNGVHECVTLEDPVRAVKVRAVTAIPAGAYEVVIGPSNRFKRDMPRVQDVPGFEGVLIHWGNTAKDTEGCILVGQSQAKNFIGSSRAAFDALFRKLEAAARRGERITLQIG